MYNNCDSCIELKQDRDVLYIGLAFCTSGRHLSFTFMTLSPERWVKSWQIPDITLSPFNLLSVSYSPDLPYLRAFFPSLLTFFSFFLTFSFSFSPPIVFQYVFYPCIFNFLFTSFILNSAPSHVTPLYFFNSGVNSYLLENRLQIT